MRSQKHTLILLLSILLIWGSCETSPKKSEDTSNTQEIETPTQSVDTTSIKAEPKETLDISQLHDTAFLFLEKISDQFVYDMRYASENNFMKTKVYTCDKCLIRKEVALALIKANDSLLAQGYKIKFYDCYRSLSIQKLMWEVFPNKKYVADPKYGSMHNRGGAVDITLVDLEEHEVDMGTGFDHFGVEAHHAYTNLAPHVLANRKRLKTTMERCGFNSITSEWWHYSYTHSKYAISDFETE